jgi:hypothetical protein
MRVGRDPLELAPQPMQAGRLAHAQEAPLPPGLRNSKLRQHAAQLDPHIIHAPAQQPPPAIADGAREADQPGNDDSHIVSRIQESAFRV